MAYMLDENGRLRYYADNARRILADAGVPPEMYPPSMVGSNTPDGKPNPFGNTTYSPEVQGKSNPFGYGGYQPQVQGKPNPFGNTTYSPMQFEAYPEPAKVTAGTPPTQAAGGQGNMPQNQSGLSLLDLVASKPQKQGINQADALMAIGSGMLGLSADPNLQKLGMAGFGQVDERRTTRQAEAKAKDMANRTAQWLQSNKRPDLAQAVAGGFLDAKDGIKLAMEKSDLPNRVQEAMFYMNNPEIANRMKELGFIGGGGTNVTLKQAGQIPVGYKAIYDDAGNLVRYEQIEGSPQQAAEGARVAGQGETANIVIEKIDRLNEMITKDQTFYDPIFGVGGLIAQYIPSSNRSNAMALADTIIANAGFAQLAKMREESPTGGALGQVTELELKMLQSTIASLKFSQSEDQFLQNLGDFKRAYQKVLEKASAYPNAAKYGFGGAQSGGGNVPMGDPLGLFN